MKSRWSVVTIYEGLKAREAAVAFCQDLVERFWTKLDFDVYSCSYEELAAEPTCSRAKVRAAAADLILFSVENRDVVPFHIKEWIDDWLAYRREREGTLAALLSTPGPHGLTHAYLRQVAHRAGLDFLTELPNDLPPFSDSPEFYTKRATQVTSVLTDILRQPPPPSLL